MDIEWTLALSEIADGEAAQALAQGLRTPQQAPAIAAPFQAEGGKGADGIKPENFVLPISHTAQGNKDRIVQRALPQASAAQGLKSSVMSLPAATLAQGDKTVG